MKKYCLLIVGLFSFLLVGNVDALNLDLTWHKKYTYGADQYFSDAYETNDGGVVAVGSTYANENPNYRDYNLYSYSIIAKYDKEGNLTWGKCIENSIELVSVVEDDEENIYAIGYIFSNLNKDVMRNSILFKYDKEGNLLFEKKYLFDTYDDEEYKKISFNNGYLYVIGKYKHNEFVKSEKVGNWMEYTYNQKSETFVNKFNKNGDLLDHKEFDIVESEYVHNSSLSSYSRIKNNSDIIFDSNNIYLHYDNVVKKFDENFNELWSYVDVDYKINSIDKTYDGGIIASGYKSLGNYSDAVILKLNSKGEKEWEDVLAGNKNDYFYSVATYKDNYIVLGLSYSTDIGIDNTGTYIMTYNKTGKLVDKYYIGNYLNLFWGFEQMHLKGNNLYAYGISENKTYFNRSSEESQASIIKLSLSFKIDVESSIGGKIEIDKNLYKVGDKVIIKVNAKEGYVLGAIGGAKVEKINDETYTFIMPAEDIILKPEFIIDSTIKESDDPVSLPDSKNDKEDDSLIKNPETGGNVSLVFGILLLFGIIIFKRIKNKRIYKI